MTVRLDLDKRRNHERRTGTSDEISKTITQAGRVLEACGILRSPSWISRTVRSYLRHAAPKVVPFGAWLVTQVQLSEANRRRVLSDPELRYVLVYRDPTGESAIHHVMTTPSPTAVRHKDPGPAPPDMRTPPLVTGGVAGRLHDLTDTNRLTDLSDGAHLPRGGGA